MDEDVYLLILYLIGRIILKVQRKSESTHGAFTLISFRAPLPFTVVREFRISESGLFECVFVSASLTRKHTQIIRFPN